MNCSFCPNLTKATFSVFELHSLNDPLVHRLYNRGSTGRQKLNFDLRKLNAGRVAWSIIQEKKNVTFL